MAVEFSVPSHTTYFAGYLDAVGRQFSTASRRCDLAAQVMPSTMLDGIAVTSAIPVEKMIVDFERDISHFLNASPRDPLVFYLTEYFGWYDDFSDACTCEKLILEGANLSPDHFAYRLQVNNDLEVVFLASWGARAMPNKSLERTREEYSAKLIHRRVRRSAQPLGGMMSFRDLRTRLSQASGHFSRSRREALETRALAIFLFLLGCYLVGMIIGNFGRIHYPVLRIIALLVVIGLIVLSFALFRHGAGCYSINDGEICFERPKGKVRWKERIADMTGVGQSVDWFWERWVVLQFGNRKRRLELLPSLVEALNHEVPPNKSLERTREG